MKNLKNALIISMSILTSYSFGQKLKAADLKNPTIKAFIMAIDGTEATAEKIVTRTGSKEVIENGMLPTGKIHSIKSEDGNCVRFSTLWVIDEDDKEDGAEEMIYDICEEGGKIVSFDLVFEEE